MIQLEEQTHTHPEVHSAAWTTGSGEVLSVVLFTMCIRALISVRTTGYDLGSRPLHMLLCRCWSKKAAGLRRMRATDAPRYLT